MFFWGKEFMNTYTWFELEVEGDETQSITGCEGCVLHGCETRMISTDMLILHFHLHHIRYTNLFLDNLVPFYE